MSATCWPSPGAGAVVRKDFAAGSLRLPLIRVDDPLRAAQDLAAHVREKYRAIKYVGITGSAGKTTTKEFAFQILSQRRRCFRSPQNWNNWIGLPFSLLKMSGSEEAAVFELAMSDPGIGEIDRLAGILKPDVAVLLNVFPVHLEFLKTLENAARAKGEILDYLQADGCAFVNGDSALLRRVARGRQGRMIFFGSQPAGNQVLSEKGRARGRRQPPGASTSSASRRNSSRRWSAAPRSKTCLPPSWWPSALGMKNFEIQEAVSRLQPLAGRGQFRRLGRVTLIDETYNSNPEALKKTLQWVDREYAGRKVAVLGDMLELGEDESAFHREVGPRFRRPAFRPAADRGPRAPRRSPRRHARRVSRAGASPASQDALAAGEFLRGPSWNREAVVLFKGSRGMALEKAIAEFSHE